MVNSVEAPQEINVEPLTVSSLPNLYKKKLKPQWWWGKHLPVPTAASFVTVRVGTDLTFFLDECDMVSVEFYPGTKSLFSPVGYFMVGPREVYGM